MKAAKIILKIVLKIAKILAIVLSVLFAVYFWNLDQKVMAILYKVMNAVFDRKKVDIKF